MSDILSQEQIDQLLNAGIASANAPPDTGDPRAPGQSGRYASLEKTLEVFCAQASTVLSTVLNKKVSARMSLCAKADEETVKKELTGETLCVSLPFKSGFAGELYLFITKKDTAVLGDLMLMGEGNAEYGPEHNDAITELSNQIFSSFTLTLSAEIGVQVSSAPSKMTNVSPDNPPPGELDMAILRLSIEGREDAAVVLYIPEAVSGQIAEKNPAGEGTGSGNDLVPEGFDSGLDFGETSGEFESDGQTRPRNRENIEMLLDVDLDVSIELGRSNLSIKRILELAPGSIVELDRMAGEPVDLTVNNKVVAKGEVVVIDESFGIRIISLISPEERIKSLR